MAVLAWQRESFGCTEECVLKGAESGMGTGEPRERHAHINPESIGCDGPNIWIK